jgi:hypothetical protein
MANSNEKLCRYCGMLGGEDPEVGVYGCAGSKDGNAVNCDLYSAPPVSLNRGLLYSRTEAKFPRNQINREKVFADQWEQANIPEPSINYGHGIAQDLFMDGPVIGSIQTARLSPYAIYKLTRRERVIIATIVQWLGSNCGWSFLSKCVELCGHRIVRKED